jgi:hypothetical protein
MDPYVCCLLGICCPPESAQQLDTLTTLLLERGEAKTKKQATRMATFHLSLLPEIRKALE